MIKNKTKKFFIILGLALLSMAVHSQISLNHIFGNNMVLQRDKPVKIWGWAAPGENVTIKFAGQVKSSITSDEGEWVIYLDPMSANAVPQDFVVVGDNSSVTFNNVLVGDVWILGGQSNMEFDLARIYNGDAEVVSANFPLIRLMTIPRAVSHIPLKDFKPLNEYDSWNNRYEKKGYWFICSPETVKTFSGLGYIFGRRIQMASKIPIGLIDVSRGGTTVEAWMSTKTLSETLENKKLLKLWEDKIAAYDPEENLKKKIRNWEKRTASRKKLGQKPNPKPVKPDPGPALNQNRPGSCYNGMLSVFAGLTVKGVIFHQGYNNALSDARPKLYALNFKLLIKDWRKAFNNDKMPFCIVEFSAGGTPQTLDNFEESMIDAAPFIREGQFKAYKDMDNVGYVCAYDQQVNWYHPQKKVEIGERIARWAMSTQYGFDLGWEPAEYTNVEKLKDKIIITFSKEIKTSDDRPFEGFAIAGIDRHFYPAEAKYVALGKNNKGEIIYDKKKLEIFNKLVPEPKEVRYAWARNPIGNVVNNTMHERIIPLPLFRTDKWDYPEAPYDVNEMIKHRKNLNMLRRESKEWAHLRIIQEAEQVLKENKLELK
ncbi:MAG TPA: hypothetical protein ENK25_01835 [Bacteroidetes bacterium]|nr:hypothetical protein [Bacteroidota bacterium]